MTKIYTRTGDQGETGLFGTQRVRKDDLRVEAYGTVDELNAVIGLARIHSSVESFIDLDTLLQTIQQDLFTLGADLATPPDDPTTRGRVVVQRVAPEQVIFLETEIDRFEEEVPPLTQFILPGGSPLSAALHHARVVCRRAERRTVTLANHHPASAPNATGNERVNNGEEAADTTSPENEETPARLTVNPDTVNTEEFNTEVFNTEVVNTEVFNTEVVNTEVVNTEAIRYLNRLSDLLFVLARVANHRQNIPDVFWRS